jgi:hypothetical protein
MAGFAWSGQTEPQQAIEKVEVPNRPFWRENVCCSDGGLISQRRRWFGRSTRGHSEDHRFRGQIVLKVIWVEGEGPVRTEKMIGIRSQFIRRSGLKGRPVLHSNEIILNFFENASGCLRQVEPSPGKVNVVSHFHQTLNELPGVIPGRERHVGVWKEERDPQDALKQLRIRRLEFERNRANIPMMDDDIFKKSRGRLNTRRFEARK